ncbi:hypothetical protein LJC57_07210 [Parabacteroides sp. OttesenSCG-928-G07]|nr:hypothetical protein [Parabacteroides sp. OttesenSCG-928-G07]
MNKAVVTGSVIVLAAAAGYFIGRMQEKGQLDKLSDQLNKLALKAKRDAKNTMDRGKNQLEYVQDRAEYAVKKNTHKLNGATEDL